METWTSLTTSEGLKPNDITTGSAGRARAQFYPGVACSHAMGEWAQQRRCGMSGHLSWTREVVVAGPGAVLPRGPRSLPARVGHQGQGTRRSVIACCLHLQSDSPRSIRHDMPGETQEWIPSRVAKCGVWWWLRGQSSDTQRPSMRGQIDARGGSSNVN